MNAPPRIHIDNAIYPKKAVIDAKAAFAPYADFQAVPDGGGIVLTIKVKQAYISDRCQIFLEFMNYLLDRSIQLSAEKEES